MLGEFEYLLIAAAARLGDQAYGASVQVELARATGHACSAGALYTTLDRLESKGLLTTTMSDPTPERGGRAKRMIVVTSAGRREAAQFYRAVSRVSAGVPWALTRLETRR